MVRTVLDDGADDRRHAAAFQRINADLGENGGAPIGGADILQCERYHARLLLPGELHLKIADVHRTAVRRAGAAMYEAWTVSAPPCHRGA